MNWTKEDIDTTLQAVVERSMTDPAFRAEALRDPNQAIRMASGKEVPASFKVRFVDNAGSDMTVVLPDPQAGGSELNEAELAGVAGGTIGGGAPGGGFGFYTLSCNPNITFCSPAYSKKPGSPAFCPI
jgi:hypothetical protein